MRYFRVKNYDRYQHYRDRNPIWIKLYTSLLSDHDFEDLPTASKLAIILIFLLASQYENRLKYDGEWIARKIGEPGSVDLDILVSAGFIEVCDAGSDSKPASKRASKSAILEKRREEKKKSIAALPQEPTAEASVPTPAKRDRKPKVDRPWLAGFREAQKRVYGSAVIHPRHLTALDAVVGEVGPDEALLRYEGYLAATPAKFFSADKFAVTHGAFALSGSAPQRVAAEWWHDHLALTDFHALVGSPRLNDAVELSVRVHGYFPSLVHAEHAARLVTQSAALKRALAWGKKDEAIDVLMGLLDEAAPAVPSDLDRKVG